LFGECEENHSTLRPGFFPKPFCVEFMVNQVAVGQVSHRVFRIILATIILPTLLNLTTWSNLGFCLTVHHQLGKLIQMNQLNATMIY